MGNTNRRRTSCPEYGGYYVPKDDILMREGRFLLDRSQTIDSPQFWGLVMSKMLILRCEHIFSAGGYFEYMALSPLFRVISDSEMPPAYKISQDEFGDVKVVELEDNYEGCSHWP